MSKLIYHIAYRFHALAVQTTSVSSGWPSFLLRGWRRAHIEA